jgi:hypothetical protein
MKKLITLSLLLFVFGITKAQRTSFEDESSVMSFMENKTFYNSNNGLEIEYGYISIYNTYGIKIKNKNGAKFYFINVEITPYGNSADLYGMSVENTGNFGFRIYRDRLIVGKDEPGETTYYIKK